jgi:hypothetical protein
MTTSPPNIMEWNTAVDEIKVIEAAERGDPVAHKSLVEAYWQMVNAGKTPSRFIAAYVGRAQLGRGRKWP